MAKQEPRKYCRFFSSFRAAAAFCRQVATQSLSTPIVRPSVEGDFMVIFIPKNPREFSGLTKVLTRAEREREDEERRLREEYPECYYPEDDYDDDDDEKLQNWYEEHFPEDEYDPADEEYAYQDRERQKEYWADLNDTMEGNERNEEDGWFYPY